MHDERSSDRWNFPISWEGFGPLEEREYERYFLSEFAAVESWIQPRCSQGLHEGAVAITAPGAGSGGGSWIAPVAVPAPALSVGQFVSYPKGAARFTHTGVIKAVTAANGASLYPNSQSWLYEVDGHYQGKATCWFFADPTLVEVLQQAPALVGYKSPPVWATATNAPPPAPAEPHIMGLSPETVDRDAYDEFMKGL
jgi:hypothetical protein